MPYSLLPNSTVITPKAAPEITRSDSKFVSLIYTSSIPDTAAYYAITPVIDMANLWSWFLHVKNTGGTNAIYQVDMIALASPTDAYGVGLSGVANLVNMTDYWNPIAAVNTITAGMSYLFFSKATPHPKAIQFLGRSTSGTTCECQFIGSYLHG